MLKTILVYGLIAGTVIIGVNTANYEAGNGAAWLGFLVMFICFSCIFFAVKKHRVEGFARAFGIGCGITCVAAIAYVLVWEAYLFNTNYAFMDGYVQSIINAKQTAGASVEEMATVVGEMETMKAQYANPLFRIPMTLLEILPVGLLMSLIAAFTMRKPKD